MKILLLCAKAFETMEFSVFIDTIGWARETLVAFKLLEMLIGEEKTKEVSTAMGY